MPSLTPHSGPAVARTPVYLAIFIHAKTRVYVAMIGCYIQSKLDSDSLVLGLLRVVYISLIYYAVSVF